ncbi:MAG: hypothetical protein CVV17_00385 [Gammaproteobacteria bacterium HGW-Gammaproteobacteria-7]|nr:MAG: hypothetical protein CVV17_00385 [Gammaproteobacteria bacterium HGW-Gammaproteobacteria-7]
MKKLLALCALLCLPLTAQAAESYTVLFKAQGSYQDIRDNLQMAIEGKGLKITNTNHIADMLERTGKDIGETRKVYEHAEQFEFCSATISRRMMEADPHSIVMCPYSVVVYQVPSDKTVYLAYRKPAATKNPALKKQLAELEKLLTDIIKDAM